MINWIQKISTDIRLFSISNISGLYSFNPRSCLKTFREVKCRHNVIEVMSLVWFHPHLSLRIKPKVLWSSGSIGFLDTQLFPPACSVLAQQPDLGGVRVVPPYLFHSDHSSFLARQSSRRFLD